MKLNRDTPCCMRKVLGIPEEHKYFGMPSCTYRQSSVPYRLQGSRILCPECPVCFPDAFLWHGVMADCLVCRFCQALPYPMQPSKLRSLS